MFAAKLRTAECSLFSWFCQDLMLYLAYSMPVKKSSKKSLTRTKQAYVVAVDMGYGHQRAVYPLRHLAALLPTDQNKIGKVINANSYEGIPKKDKAQWDGSQKLYEFISRFTNIPLIGRLLFKSMDYFQRIEPFYPKRDQSRPTLQLRSIYAGIKRGWGKHLIATLNQNPLPLITSFFIPAYFAEEHGYKGEIYLLCCDADVSRAWAPLKAGSSRITFLVPSERVKERLRRYGVRAEKIIMTGFPLPTENIGTGEKILQKSFQARLARLQPKSKAPLTITFCVGGAGAQRDLGVQILNSLHKKIDAGEIILNLVAGSRADVNDFYQKEIDRLHFKLKHKGCIRIIFAPVKADYFKLFNEVLLETDILWTKPSELSFYTGLGLPIIMAPTVGSQEEFNREWLLTLGAGLDQKDPVHAAEWIFEWLKNGAFAQAAKHALEAPRSGTKKITDLV